MSNYVIVSDGSCDLTQEDAKKLNVEIVPFYVVFENEQYLKEGVDVSAADFYQKMIDNPNIFPKSSLPSVEDYIFPKSSLPSVEDYVSCFEKHLRDGKDIICLCITTKFSGSYNSASSAKQLLEEEYPERKITIIDTMVNTVLQGLVVREATRLRDLGYEYNKLVDIINEKKTTGRIFFTVKELTYLQHGGRIGKVASIVGDLMKISPIIVLKEGEIHQGGIALSRKRALLKVKELAKSYVDSNKGKKFVLCVGYGYDKEEGTNFVETLSKVFPDQDIILNHIGATIGVHTGPYPIGVGILEKFD